MVKLKKLMICIGLCTSIISMTSCSYVEFENKLKDTFAGDTESDNKDNVLEGKGDENQTEVEKPVEASGEQIHSIGDTVLFKVPNETGDMSMEYTVKKVQLYDSLADAGINSQDMCKDFSSDLVLDDGSFKNNCKLMVADITVKNINWINENDMANISWVALAYLNDSRPIDELGFDLDLDYFSDHMPKTNDEWRDYFSYHLPQNESKDIKLGWFVNLDNADPSKIYICLGAATNDEYKQFIKLDLQV